jgi:hypothetical protein
VPMIHTLLPARGVAVVLKVPPGIQTIAAVSRRSSRIPPRQQVLRTG